MEDKELNEVSPKGWHGTVRAMVTKEKDKFDPEKKFKKGTKPKKGEKLNPWAVAWSMKKKGYKPHYEEQPTSKKGKPKLKKKYKDEKKMDEYLHSAFPEKTGSGPGKPRSKKRMKTFREFLQEKGHKLEE